MNWFCDKLFLVGDYMRLRNVKNKEEILKACPYLISDPCQFLGKWHEKFGNSNPIYVEIGMGKGKFIVQNALRYPEINFIGIEKFDNVLARALPMIPEGIPNLYIIRMDAIKISSVFSHEIKRIYLNFSDPWPKVRHHLRRLSSKIFLEQYDFVFSEGGEIYMRTDNQELYIYSLESFSQYGYQLEQISFDLHHDILPNFITTEYEDKFIHKGLPIYSVVAKRSVKSNENILHL